MKFFLVCGIFAGAFIYAQGQEEVCPPGESYWPHPDCNLYYICDNGNAIINQCPSGLYWEQTSHSCDYPVNVPECQGGTRPPVGEGSTTPIPTTTTRAPNSTTVASTTNPPTTTPPATTTTVQITTTTTTTTRTTTIGTTDRPTTTVPGFCPPEGIHKVAHETLCDSYYICVNGERDPNVFQCPAGLLFDPSLAECNIASDVECNTSSSTPSSGTTLPPVSTTTDSTFPECPPTGDVLIPYPGNCSLYIRCIQEVPIVYRCPNGQNFDSVDHECKDEEIAVCNVIYAFKGQIKNDEDTPVMDKENSIKPISAYFNLITKYFYKNGA